MRLGGVRVSRMALVGDPLSGALGLFMGAQKVGKALGILGRGKAKRQAYWMRMGGKPGAGGLGINGGTAGPLVTVPGGGQVSLPPLPGQPTQLPIEMSLPALLGRGIQAVGRHLGRAVVQPSQQPYSRGGTMVFPSGIAVRGRRRRMNVLNPRALRRSITRVQGFARFARKTITITQRVKLKKRRRR